MLRSLFAGVSGLTSNIVELDVVGNNISNVNTIGFKSARVTFEEILTQNIRAATRPVAGGLGGTNPQQVGLGTIVGSIDSEFAQGNLRPTGNKTDVAIQGDGFFVLSDGRQLAYSRAGNFTFDADNLLVHASTGRRVQGIMADVNGEFLAGGLTDLQIDPSVVVPAQASTEVNVFGNLSSNSDATGTRMETFGALLATSTSGDLLTSLHTGQDGQDLKLTTGAKIALTGFVGGSAIQGETFVVGTDGTNVGDLLNWMTTRLNANGGGGASVTLNPDGSVQLAAGTANLGNVKLASGGSVPFNQLMIFGDISASGTATSVSQLRSPAEGTDALDQLYNNNGQPLGFAFDPISGQTVIRIGGTLGGEAITPSQLTVTQGVTTLQELVDTMEDAFNISNDQGISITSDGLIDVVGDVELRNSIDNISIVEPGNDISNLSTSFDFRTLERAADAATFSVTSTVYDSLGNPHNLTLEFTKRTGFNTWDWSASLDKGEEIISGESGTVSFDENGSLSSFLYTDGGGQLSFRPQAQGDEGAAVVNLAINPGEVGGVNGLTQFEPLDQIQAFADGFTVGRLVDFEIDGRGVISGRFSNDTIRDLARIGVARFNNPNGMVRSGNNTFTVSGNSGQAIVGFAAEGGVGALTPGALEGSNVDLAEQFTRLVIAQRAFQSNSRVISTGDEVLQELVNIV